MNKNSYLSVCVCVCACVCVCVCVHMPLHTLNVPTHWPVVVEMAKFVAQSLNVVWFQTRRVPNHIEVSRSYRSLTNTLAHKEEVIPNKEHKH